MIDNTLIELHILGKTMAGAFKIQAHFSISLKDYDYNLHLDPPCSSYRPYTVVLVAIYVYLHPVAFQTGSKDVLAIFICINDFVLCNII